MTVIRLILLVAVLGVITLLLAQNWSPAIPLVFLGLRSQPVSLAMWMLLSTAAGACSSLLISSLVQLLNRDVARQRQNSSYEPFDSSRTKKRTPREKESYPRESQPQAANELENNYDDDWDLDDNISDDWDFGERRYQEKNYNSEYTKIQDERDYEDFQEPENDYQPADSSYSYNKRDLKNSGIGKTESVYDADYRVIIPPASSSTPTNSSQKDNNKDNNDDDWGFLDEDFDEEKPSPRQ